MVIRTNNLKRAEQLRHAHYERHRATCLPAMQFFAIGLIGTIIGLIETAPAIPLLSLFLFAVGFMLLPTVRQSPQVKTWVYTLFGWGFFLRIVCVFALYYWLIEASGSPFLGGGDDAEYEMKGKVLAELWFKGDFQLPRTMRAQAGYHYFNAAINCLGEFLGGYHILLPRLAIACAGALMAPFVFVLVRNVMGHSCAVAASVVVMIYPQFLFYSSVQLRDILIALVVVLATYQLSRFAREGKTSGIIIAIATFVPMLFLREEYAFVLLGAVIISLMGLLVLQKGYAKQQLWRKFAFLLITSIAVVFSLRAAAPASFSVSEGSRLTHPLSEGYVVEKVAYQQDHNMSGALDNSVAAKMIDRLPLAVRITVLPPIAFVMPYPPWTAFQKPGHLAWIYFIMNICWTLLMPLCLLGLWKVFRGGYFPMILLILVPMTLFLFASSAGGFQSRYKLPADPFILILAAPGIVEFRRLHGGLPLTFSMLLHTTMFVAYFIAKYVF